MSTFAIQARQETDQENVRRQYAASFRLLPLFLFFFFTFALRVQMPSRGFRCQAENNREFFRLVNALFVHHIVKTSEGIV